jgi:CSLREA domain-containing protein
MLVAFALGCGSEEAAAPTALDAAIVAIPKVVVTSLLDDGVGACTTVKCTLRDAISTAPTGADVTFAGNLCPRRATPATGCKITLAGVGLNINKDLRILGPVDYYKLAVDGGGVVDNALAVPSGAVVTVRDLTISGARLSGIMNQGTMTLKNVTVSGNGSFDGNGGGILNGSRNDPFGGSGGVVTLSYSTVSGNIGVNGGGIHNQRGSVTLTSSRVSGNTSGSGGGILSSGGTVTLTNTAVSGNTARGAGGGIWNVGSIVTLTNSSVTGNTVAFGGFGTGGGIFTEGGSVTLSGSTVSRNNADSRGGGIFTNGPVTLKNESCVNNNSVGLTVSSNPWSPVNIYINTLPGFGTVTGRNCGVVKR